VVFVVYEFIYSFLRRWRVSQYRFSFSYPSEPELIIYNRTAVRLSALFILLGKQFRLDDILH
jgi:hypothetical protein